MPKGYWIGRLEVHDPERYKDYVTTAVPAYQEFGAKLLVRGGDIHAQEGETRSRNVVIEFDSIELALACYHSETYSRARSIRQEVSDGEIVIVEGV